MPDIKPGDRLGGRFTILGVLGQGGMATVYLAEDSVRQEKVALKVLHDHLSRDPSMRARLGREVQAASRIRHPGALLPHEIHDLDGVPALSLPFYQGRTLAEQVAEDGPLSASALRRLGARLSEVLAEAHSCGVLHRDVAPGNVMLGARGEPVLMDFGLARLQDAASTRSTTSLGTPGFAAPETWSGSRGDPRSDLYGLGALLYLAATGRAPFAAPNPVAALKAQLEGRMIPIRQARPDIPEDLATIIEALLEVEPGGRPQGALEVAEALKRREIISPAPREEQLQAPQGEVVSPHLARGRWVVLVREVSQQKGRRDMERARKRGPREPGDQVRILFHHLKSTVFDALGVPEGVSPEAVMAAAVAREAGLPEPALQEAPGLLEKRFRLVDGVSRGTAERLSKVARDAGFKSGLVVHPDDDETGPWAPLLPLLVPALALLAGAMVIGPLAARIAMLGMALVLALMVVMGGIRAIMAGSSPRVESLPLAYPEDLRPLLAPGYSYLLQAPPDGAEGPADQIRDQAGAGPGAVLLGRVEARLLALEEILAEEGPSLPDKAVAELARTLQDLRQQARDLADEIDSLDRELASFPEVDQTLAPRLERLGTLERAGAKVDPSERRRLEAASREAAELGATADALEERRTAAMSRLMDIGATAARVRRELLQEEEPSRSVERLAGDLERQARAASRARRETARS